MEMNFPYIAIDGSITDAELPSTSKSPRPPSPVPSLGRDSICTAISRPVHTPQLTEISLVENPKTTSKKPHATSLVWQSDVYKKREEWRQVHQRLLRTHKLSAQVPWTFEEWITHCESEKLHEKLQSFNRKKAERDTERMRAIPDPKLMQLSPGRATVLGKPTIWCPQPDQNHSAQIWPSLEEFKHEGDERVATGFGRYMPIVRDWRQWKPVMPWCQVPALVPYPLDAVDRRAESHVEIDREEVSDLLNSDLLVALDKNDYDFF